MYKCKCGAISDGTESACAWCGDDDPATLQEVETLTNPSLIDQIAAIMQVKPDGPMGRRILSRIHELGY